MVTEILHPDDQDLDVGAAVAHLIETWARMADSLEGNSPEPPSSELPQMPVVASHGTYAAPPTTPGAQSAEFRAMLARAPHPRRTLGGRIVVDVR